MATNYPTGYDVLANPGANLSSSPLHSVQHTNLNDAVEAVQAELGLTPRGTDATVAARLTRLDYLGRKAFAQVTTTSSANPGTTALLSAPSFTAIAGRRYKTTITFYDAVIVGSGTTEVQVRRSAGAVTVGAARVGSTAGTYPGNSISWTDVPGAGSVTYVFYTFTNATSVQIEASSAAPFSILVEDIGT